jgi:hypothetical protein
MILGIPFAFLIIFLRAALVKMGFFAGGDSPIGVDILQASSRVKG